MHFAGSLNNFYFYAPKKNALKNKSLYLKTRKGFLWGGMFFLLFLIYSSCNEGATTTTKGISEGQIDFKVEFLEDEREKPIISLMPNNVTTSFKNNSSHTIIDDNLGLFKLVYIVNRQANKNYSIFKFFDKKYVYESDLNEVAFGYEPMEDLEIVCTEKTKKIAGYNCKHALAIHGAPKDSIELYYTNEIDLLSPNSNSPFKEIDGVLMEFSVKLAGFHLKFKAQKVKETKVDDKIFTLPDGYLHVSKEKMQEVINGYN